MLVACLAMETKGGSGGGGVLFIYQFFLHDIQSNFSN